ncbi:MAG: integrase core domain-containing protein [Acidimicrobiia bacterium]
MNGTDPDPRRKVRECGSRPTGWVPLSGSSGPFLLDPSGRCGRRRSGRRPYLDQRLINVAGFLTGKAWPTLGIPYSLQIDNAFCLYFPRAKLKPWNVFVRTCLFFGVEVVVSPPNELGWAQHVESFNGLWQNRTIRRHRYQEVAEVEVSSDRFCDYYNHQRPHPRLRVATPRHPFPRQVDRKRPRPSAIPPRRVLDL